MPYLQKCPHCGNEGLTVVVKAMNMMGYIAMLVLFLVFNFMLLFLIPCCIDSCHSFTHNCPNCHQTVAVANK